MGVYTDVDTPGYYDPDLDATSANENRNFLDWYVPRAELTGISTNPDDPLHNYDYRAAWRAGAEPEFNEELGIYKWPSKFKRITHETRFITNAEGVVIDTKFDEPFNIRKLDLDEIEYLYNENLITDNDVVDYTAHKTIVEHGFYSLDPIQAEHAYKNGWLTPEQVELWYERNENPAKFWAKELFWRAPAAGAVSAVDNVVKKANALGNFIGSFLGLDSVEVDTLSKFAPEPQTIPGNIEKVLVQFGIGYGPARMLLNKIDKFGPFILDALASAVSTSTVMDPYDDRLVDILMEHTDLMDPVLDLLNSKEDDPLLVATVKSATEDVILSMLLGAGIRGAQHLANRVSKAWTDAVLLKKSSILNAAGEDYDLASVETAKLAKHIAEKAGNVNSKWYPKPNEYTVESRITTASAIRQTGADPKSFITIQRADDIPVSTIDEAAAATPKTPPPGTPSSKLQPNDIVNGDTYSLLKQRIIDQRGVREELANVLSSRVKLGGAKQGLLDFEDWINQLDSKILIEEKMKHGIQISEARKRLAPALNNLKEKYNEVRRAYIEGGIEGLRKLVEQKQYTAFVTDDNGAVLPLLHGADPDELSRRVNTVISSEASIDVFTKKLQAEGYVFDKLKKAARGEPLTVDIKSSTKISNTTGGPVEYGGTKLQQQFKPVRQVERVVEKVPKPTRPVPMAEVQLKEALSVVDSIAEGTLKIGDIADFELFMHRYYDPALGFTRINVRQFLEPETAFQLIEHVARKIEPEMGVMTHKQIMQDAHELFTETLGMSPRATAAIIEEYANMANRLPSVLKVTRSYMKAYADLVFDLAEKASTVEEREVLRQLLANYVNIQYNMEKMVAGAGRSLNSMNIKINGPEDPLKWLDKEAMERFLSETAADTGALVDAVKRLKREASNPHAALSTMLKQWDGVRWVSMVEHLAKSAMISGFDTLKGNILGTSGIILKDYLELVGSMALHGALHGDKELYKQAWLVSKAYPMAFMSALKGIGPEGWKKFAKLLKEGWRETDDGVRGALKYAQTQIQMDESLGAGTRALFSGEPQLDRAARFEHQGGIPNLKNIPLGDLISLPFRMLTATDEPLQNMVHEAYKRVFAIEHAIKQGLRGSALDEAVTRLLAENPVWLANKAFEQSRVLTFKNSLEGSMKRFHDLLNANHNSSYAAKVAWGFGRILFIPFDKVVMNIGRTIAENSLLGVIGKRFREDFAAGGLRRTQAALRVATGTLMIMAGYQMYQPGRDGIRRLIGAIPHDLKPLAQSAGIQEYSLYNEETGQYESIRRLDPVAKLWTLGADIGALFDTLEAYQEGNIENVNELVWTAIGIAGEFLGNFVAMDGVQQFSNMITGGTQAGVSPGQWASQQLGKFFPLSSAARDFNKYAISREQKKIRSVFDEWDATRNSTIDNLLRVADAGREALIDQFVPGMRSKLLPLRDPLYGHVRYHEDRIISILSQRRTLTDDPALLHMLDIGLNFKPMDDKVTLRGETIRLNAHDYDKALANLETIKMNGRTGLREILNSIVADPRWEKINDTKTKREILAKVISEARRTAKLLVVNNDPALKAKLDAKFAKRIDAKLGIVSDKDPRRLLYYGRTYLETDPTDLIGPDTGED